MAFITVPYLIMVVVYFSDISPSFSQSIVRYKEAEILLAIGISYPAIVLGMYRIYIFVPRKTAGSTFQGRLVSIFWLIFSLAIHTFWFVSFTILFLSGGRVIAAFLFNWVEVVVIYSEILPNVMLVTSFVVMANDFYDRLQQPYLFSKLWLLHYDRPALSVKDLVEYNKNIIQTKNGIGSSVGNSNSSSALVPFIKTANGSVSYSVPNYTSGIPLAFMDWRTFYRLVKRTSLRRLQLQSMARFGAEFSFVMVLFLVITILQQYTMAKTGNYSAIFSALLPFVPSIFGQVTIQSQFWNSVAYLHHVMKQQLYDARAQEESARGCIFVLLRQQQNSVHPQKNKFSPNTMILKSVVGGDDRFSENGNKDLVPELESLLPRDKKNGEWSD